MDSALSTAARALSVGDPLSALKLVALRADAAALALRGIAMAQLGELARARQLLKRSAATFGAAEPVARARALVAEAEVTLALRELRSSQLELELEQATLLLSRSGDRVNALFARLVQVRRLALLGQSDVAARKLDGLSLSQAPPRLVALAALIEADLAMKRADARAAHSALARARAAALGARIPALLAEVERAEQQLVAPVARLQRAGQTRSLQLGELEPLFASGALVVDACRREARLGARVVSLLTRPLLLELLVALAEAAPEGAPREQLIMRVFGARRVNESHRVRLRVEIGRLRKLLAGLARLEATPTGFALTPLAARGVATLLPPAEGEASALLSLLRGGEAWSTSALAAAIGKSQRAVQRALLELTGDGKVRAAGRGPAQRWIATPTAGFATTLLLVAPGSLG
jgi:hypothetical protein